MAQQKNAHVPKFGNWDSDGNVPYTLFFENARKGKGAGAAAGGKMINPNDPAENPEAFSVAAPSPPPGRHERRPSDAPPPPMSPNPYYAAGSPYHRHAAGEPPRRAGGYSVDQSPAHPYSSESAGYGLVASSVDRSRAKGASRGNETPTRGSAVPKFGDWDANPASADGYTHIFNKVREEKQTTQAGKPAAYGKDGMRTNGPKQHDDDGYVSSKFSCFGWCK